MPSIGCAMCVCVQYACINVSAKMYRILMILHYIEGQTSWLELCGRIHVWENEKATRNIAACSMYIHVVVGINWNLCWMRATRRRVYSMNRSGRLPSIYYIDCSYIYIYITEIIIIHLCVIYAYMLMHLRTLILFIPTQGTLYIDSLAAQRMV